MSELYLHQVPENTGYDPGDHMVFPSLVKITAKIPWLQLLQIKLTVFCNLFETKQFCKLLKNCKHLNGVSFLCPIGEMFSNKQILNCVNEIVKIFKEIQSNYMKKEKNDIIQIIIMIILIEE